MKLKIHGSLRSLLAAFGGYWHFVLLATCGGYSRFALLNAQLHAVRPEVASSERSERVAANGGQ